MKKKRNQAGGVAIVGLFIILVSIWFSFESVGILKSDLAVLPYSPDQVGRMVIVGKASAIDIKQVEIAPGSEMPCIAYEFLVKEYRKGGGHGGYYHTVLREQQGLKNLSVETPTGPVQIKSEEVDFAYPSFEDQQIGTKAFEQPRTLSLLKNRHIRTAMLGLRLGIRVRESFVQAGDVITVIGDHTSTDYPPVLENAIISDKSLAQRITASKIELGYQLLMFLIGCVCLIVSIRLTPSDTTDSQATKS